jgi:hypothetical protein
MFDRRRWNVAQYQPSEPNVTCAEMVQQRRQAAERVVFLAVTVYG